jgi:hypothetical protein
MAAAAVLQIPERTLLAATDALGVRTHGGNGGFRRRRARFWTLPWTLHPIYVDFTRLFLAIQRLDTARLLGGNRMGARLHVQIY